MKGLEILLGVSGSIAAYKAAELARLFQQEGAQVQAVMTKSACEFITPLTFFCLTGREAYSELFSRGPEVATAHISLARQADLVVIAPATARTIARIAHGSAEDLLSTAVIAANGPVVIAPAMNPQMYHHPGVQANLKTIQSWPNYTIATPASGLMACGEVGVGRLATPTDIIDLCRWVLAGGHQDLQGQRFLVTAGPTLEDLDPVRYLTNRSSGKMGFAIAHAAAQRGADVRLITSVRQVPPPPGTQPIYTRSAQDMHEAVHQYIKETDVIIMAAAVADYRPSQVSSSKMKKSDDALSIPLERTPDILASLPHNPNRITIGFAAETDDVLKNAQGKLERKRLDLIVANDVSEADSGFGVETNRVTFLRPNQEPKPLPLLRKRQVADAILDEALAIRQQRS